MLLVWYPASTLAASASHAPAARLGDAPQAGIKPPGREDAQIRFDAAAREMTAARFQPDVRLGDEM